MKINKINIIASVSLIFLVALIFIYPFHYFYVQGGPDYEIHLAVAKKMLNNSSIINAHFLYHLLIILVVSIIPITLRIAGFYIVPILSFICLGLIIYSIMAQEIGQPRSYKHSLYYVLISIALMLIGPISLFTWPNLYLGYIGINVYHNPTVLVARPLSLLIFYFLGSLFSQSNHNDKKLTLSLMVLTVLSLIAKPSYLICLIPALILLIIYRLFKKNDVSWIVLILGVFIPAFIVLGWQYTFLYASNQTDNQIIFAPFAVQGHYSKQLLEKFCLSILFPVWVYVTYVKSAFRNSILNFSWLVFFVSIFYRYFLAESGDRMLHGNFGWGAQISLLILFVNSAIFLLKKENLYLALHTEDWKIRFKGSLCIIIFCLHLFSGILFYLYPRNW